MLQVISTLARGSDVRKKILFAGGPLTFFPRLREAFVRLLDLHPERDLAVCDHPERIAAVLADGAARAREQAGRVLMRARQACGLTRAGTVA